MRAPVLLAVLGVFLAAALGFAAHVVAQDTIGLPAVTLEGGRPLSPEEARRTTAETTETETEPETETRPRTETEPETETRTDNSGPGSSNSGPGSGDDNSGSGSSGSGGRDD